jgi:hypothetical protein
VDHIKNAVGAYEIMGPYRRALTIDQLLRQLGWIDRHRAVEAGQAGADSTIDRGLVLVDILGEICLGAGPARAIASRGE